MEADRLAVAGREQDIVLFGKSYASPFGIAPVGISALSAYRGDVVLAQKTLDLRVDAR